MTTNQELCARLARNMHGIAYCPVTDNTPTRMQEESFRRRCALYQQRAAENKGHRVGWCLTCRGEHLPPGLEFSTLGALAADPPRSKKKQQQESDMEKTNKGQCELCLSDGKSLKKYDRMMVCASCQPVLIAAKNRPLSVQAALARFDNLPVAELKETNAPVPEEPKKQAEEESSVEIRLAKMEEYVERIERLGEMLSFLCAPKQQETPGKQEECYE